MRDAGLQPERTALAWRRTALAMLVNGALLARASVKADSTVIFIVSIALVGASLSTFGIAAWRRNELLSEHAPRSPHWVLMMLLAAIVGLSTAAGVLGVVETSASVR
jgi:putative membrane protein